MIFTKIICLLCLESVLSALFGRHLKSRTKNVSIFKPFNFLECFLPQSFMRHVSLELNKYFFIHLHLVFSELMDTIDSAASRYVDKKYHQRWGSTALYTAYTVDNVTLFLTIQAALHWLNRSMHAQI